jgi:hypothetical protein
LFALSAGYIAAQALVLLANLGLKKGASIPYLDA